MIANRQGDADFSFARIGPDLHEGVSALGQSIEYQKVMTEIVYINLPGPAEPTPGMSGGEMLHGFLADLHETDNAELKNVINMLSGKWNVHFRYMK
jgi:hypothetical protein